MDGYAEATRRKVRCCDRNCTTSNGLSQAYQEPLLNRTEEDPADIIPVKSTDV